MPTHDQLLATTELILRTNPFHSHISDAERNRRITAAFAQAEKRLTECAQQKGIDLKAAIAICKLCLCKICNRAGPPLSPTSIFFALPAKPIFPTRSWTWFSRSKSRPLLFAGRLKGLDLALLLISQKREAASQ